MKIINLSRIQIVLFPFKSFAQVGINETNTAPNVSSMLDIISKDKGILIPRMTETPRNAIANSANGLLVYQTARQFGFYFYEGSIWSHLTN